MKKWYQQRTTLSGIGSILTGVGGYLTGTIDIGNAAMLVWGGLVAIFGRQAIGKAIVG